MILTAVKKESTRKVKNKKLNDIESEHKYNRE